MCCISLTLLICSAWKLKRYIIVPLHTDCTVETVSRTEHDCVFSVLLCICVHVTFKHTCVCVLVHKHTACLWLCCDDVCVCKCGYVYIHVRVRMCETNSIPISFNLIWAPLGAFQLTWKGRGEPERPRPRTGPPRWGRGSFKGLIWPRRDQQTQLICHCNSIFTSFQFQRAVWLH